MICDEGMCLLNSGRRFYANAGLLSLSLRPDVLGLHEGYDGVVDTPDDGGQFTAVERREIADAVIARWERWVKEGA